MTTLLHILPAVSLIITVLIIAGAAERVFEFVCDTIPAVNKWREREIRKCPAMRDDETEDE